MAYYQLARSSDSDRLSSVSSVVYERAEDGTPLEIGVNQAAELSDQQVAHLQSAGYKLVKADQPVGDDVAAESPIVGTTPTGVKADQQEMQRVQSPSDAGTSPQSDEVQ